MPVHHRYPTNPHLLKTRHVRKASRTCMLLRLNNTANRLHWDRQALLQKTQSMQGVRPRASAAFNHATAAQTRGYIVVADADVVMFAAKLVVSFPRAVSNSTNLLPWSEREVNAFLRIVLSRSTLANMVLSDTRSITTYFLDTFCLSEMGGAPPRCAGGQTGRTSPSGMRGSHLVRVLED